jgi:transposase-like protein
VPRTCDPEFRRRVLELVQAGRPVRVIAAELGLAEATVYRWKAQDLIDRGVKPGTSTSEQGELAACLPTSTGTATNSAGSTAGLARRAAGPGRHGHAP